MRGQPQRQRPTGREAAHIECVQRTTAKPPQPGHSRAQPVLPGDAEQLGRRAAVAGQERAVYGVVGPGQRQAHRVQLARRTTVAIDVGTTNRPALLEEGHRGSVGAWNRIA